jgi:acetyl/propionyl-CoA carboxylase alpha subunit
MKRALAEFVVRGIKTSIPFHLRVFENERFLSGHYDTSLIETELLAKTLGDTPAEAEERNVALLLAAIEASAERYCGRYGVTLGKDTHRVELKEAGVAVCEVRVDDGQTLRIDFAKSSRTQYSILVAGRQFACSVDVRANGKLEIRVGSSAFSLAAVEAG